MILRQVVKNASLRSCEGLALPFLCNWLFGDLTNLIGCLLTDQLPFQTYLAIYFCLIDLCLVWQFFHYKKPRPVPLPPSANQTPRYISYNTLVQSPQQSLILPVPPASAPAPRTRSSSGPHQPVQPATARPRPKRGLYPSTTSVNNHFPPDINITSPADGSYQAIYEAALDVARAAERASHRRSRSKRRRLSRQTSASAGLADIADEDMMESFHSEMSGQSSSTIGGQGGSPRGDRSRLTQSTGTLLDTRGRSMTRTRTRSHGGTGPASPIQDHDQIEGLPTTASGLQLDSVDMRESKRSQSRSLSLARGSGGRGGRRAAGVAFMSLGLLVGWGEWNTPRTIGVSHVAEVAGGRVIPHPIGVETSRWSESAIRHPSLFSPPQTSPRFSDHSHLETFLVPTEQEEDTPTAPRPHPIEEPPNLQRIIGRVSAWACTTLYLTSRLPQIWKNFQRKSVEGLSILLFLFAFLGNTTYVSSILLNPSGGSDPTEAGHYLLEALPYLLGSGGTLMFDLTIMIQSVIYGSAPPVPQPPTPMERSSRRRGYFSSKRKVRHLEDGIHHPHPHANSYGSGHGHGHARAHSLQGERAPLLASASSSSNIGTVAGGGALGISGLGLGITNIGGVGMESSRSASPERDSGHNRIRSKSRKRKDNADGHGPVPTSTSMREGLSQSPVRGISSS
ncbi:hypothetical protein I316_01761 [Kwoniella heveanensis BCC8398]|uniref:Vacuolar membrane protein n=1 Tax=Kwoniella heveanensis BCC8398 TaxID=1296120 RepID=A0A1B9GZR2_9TREE|nr:hypothetical protein I316_01761 [Kwoniella heveanensis BCC8398]